MNLIIEFIKIAMCGMLGGLIVAGFMWIFCLAKMAINPILGN